MKQFLRIVSKAGLSSFVSVAIMYTLLDVFGMLNTYNFAEKLIFLLIAVLSILIPTALAFFIKDEPQQPQP